jgi:hypothetical protein
VFLGDLGIGLFGLRRREAAGVVVGVVFVSGSFTSRRPAGGLYWRRRRRQLEGRRVL